MIVSQENLANFKIDGLMKIQIAFANQSYQLKMKIK